MNFLQINEIILAENGLNQSILLDSLDLLMERKLDFGDFYFQLRQNEFWFLEDQIVKEGTYFIDQGIGVRAVLGDKIGFAYSDKINLDVLNQSVNAAKCISTEKTTSFVHPFVHSEKKSIFSNKNPLISLQNEEKITILQQIDKLARSLDHRVKQVKASLSGENNIILIAATDGTFASDFRPLVHLSVSILVEDENGNHESGHYGGGARLSYDFFTNEHDPKIEYYVQEALRIALVNLKAKSAPAGTFPVVLGSGFSGVLLHEAVGHGLEGDFNRKNVSVFSGKIGEKVTSELCTIIDDGTIKNRRGSLNIDDEGTPTQKNILIENGILKKYMQDKLNARLMNTNLTGNARRQSYAHLPMPRMTNTYMLSGRSKKEEMIESVDFGVYATTLSGGQVDITSGKFVFSTSEAYLIKNGKISHPIKGVTLIGSGIEVMNQISMIADDFLLDSGVGMCGKQGQSVPVGVGQPTIKVDRLTIGGTEFFNK